MEAKIYDFYSFLYTKWATQYVNIFETNNMDITAANEWAKENIPYSNFSDLRPYITEELNKRGYTLSVFE